MAEPELSLINAEGTNTLPNFDPHLEGDHIPSRFLRLFRLFLKISWMLAGAIALLGGVKKGENAGN